MIDGDRSRSRRMLLLAHPQPPGMQSASLPFRWQLVAGPPGRLCRRNQGTLSSFLAERTEAGTVRSMSSLSCVSAPAQLWPHSEQLHQRRRQPCSSSQDRYSCMLLTMKFHGHQPPYTQSPVPVATYISFCLPSARMASLAFRLYFSSK